MGTFDGSNVKLYLDGKLEATTANTSTSWTDNHYFCIGAFCDILADLQLDILLDLLMKFRYLIHLVLQLKFLVIMPIEDLKAMNQIWWGFATLTKGLTICALVESKMSVMPQVVFKMGTAKWNQLGPLMIERLWTTTQDIFIGKFAICQYRQKGMEIYGISTTQFKYRWTGDQTWSSAVNFSSFPLTAPAQLGTTNVYVGFDTTNGAFGDESYFLIPSWAVEQFSSTRGVRRSFPERSYLVATDRSVDIIDADDNTLWMRTSNGVAITSSGTQTLNVPSGVNMTQGQLVVSTNGTAGTGVYRLDFNRDTSL